MGAPEKDVSPYRSAAFGIQSYSGRITAPLYSFGTGTNEQRHNHQYSGKEFSGHEPHLAVSPGPGAYTPASPRASDGSFSKLRNRWGADVTPRDHYGLPKFAFQGTRGPGGYAGAPNSTMGMSLPSTAFPTSPRYSWARNSTRESSTAKYLGPEHERELLGSFSPGPHAVGREVYDSMGMQLSSTKRSNPRFASPRAARTSLKMSAKSDTFTHMTKGSDTSSWPGPGQYNC